MPGSDATGPQEVRTTNSANSSFRSQLDELIVGRRVRVEAPDGKRFEGTLESVSLEDRNVILRDIVEVHGGTTASAALVAQVDWIVPVDDETD